MNYKSLLSALIFIILFSSHLFSQWYKSPISDTIDVINYSIHLENIDHDTQEISGYTELLLTTKVNNTSIVSLELLDLTIDEVSINGTQLSFDHANPFLRITLNDPINPDDEITLKINYHGEPFHEGWGGFHWWGSDYAYNLGVGFVSDPHNLGKAWFPCVDDFRDRASYDFYITVPEEKMAVCGGELITDTDNEDGTHTLYWRLDRDIPTYLASVAVGYYELVEYIYDGLEREIPFQNYVRPQDTSKVASAFQHYNEIMEIFENSFGPYQWSRVGFTSTSNGAMEHATNISYPPGGLSLSSEWWWTHELAHMWFGDLITCSSAEDMWINEGVATFMNLMYIEYLYGHEEFVDEMRDRHRDVIGSAHSSDGGFYPLYPIPTNITYGTHAYDKGAIVTQSLRGYLGYELFYEAMTALVQENAFKSISSYEMRDFLTNYTGVDMTDFFDTWVFTPGYPHFAISKFESVQNGDHYDVTVQMTNKHYGGENIALSNICEITFMDSEWNSFTDTIHFDGPIGSSVIQVPFNPVTALLDKDFNMCDATINDYKIINEAGDYNFHETDLSIEVSEVADSALIHVSHSWVPPDGFETEIPGLTISDRHYWKIDGIIPEDLDATAEFMYRKNGFENNILVTENDSCVIVYRADASEEWHEIPFERFGLWNIGYLYVDVNQGEYAFAVWDKTYVGTTQLNKNSQLKVYPNPSSHEFNIEFTLSSDARMDIYNTDGSLIKSFSVNESQKSLSWQPGDIANGNYFINLTSGGKLIARQAIIYKR